MKYPHNTFATCYFSIRKIQKKNKEKIQKKNYKKKYCDQLEDVLLLFNIVVGHDAHLQLGKLVTTSPNADMANFLSFDVYKIDLSKTLINF
jgi:hypothetical protein